MAFGSVTAIKSVGGASDYLFSQEKGGAAEYIAGGAADYLVGEKGEKSDLERVTWHGTGLKSVGLEEGATATKAQYAAVFSGNHAETGERFRNHIRSGVERPGMEFTLSASKSFSIAASQDERLARALDQAAKETFAEFAEGLTGLTTKGGERVVERLDAVYVVAGHYSSRPVKGQEVPDPQAHWHGHFNATGFTKDGRPLSVDTANYFEKREAATVNFSLRAAKVAQELGYAVKVTDRGQALTFELEGITDQAAKDMSQRKQIIDAKVEELRAEMPRASEKVLREKANLATRDDKAEVSREAVAAHVAEYRATDGKTIADMLTDSRAIAAERATAVVQDVAADKDARAKGLHEGAEYTDRAIHGDIRSALGALTDKEAYITSKDLLVQAAKISAEGNRIFSPGEFKTALDELKTSGEIVSIGEQKYEARNSTLKGEMITPAETLKQEMSLAELVEQGRGKGSPVLERDEITAHIEKHNETTKFPLTAGQASLVQTLLGSKDQFTFVQGDAGTGKTTSIAFVMDMKEELGLEKNFIGIAPSRTAVGEMRSRGIWSETPEYILACPKIAAADISTPEMKNGTLYLPEKGLHLIVDEASMMSTKNTFELVKEKLIDNGIRFDMTAMGDINQHKSIGAGRFHENGLSQGGEYNAELKEVVRQKSNSAILLATAFRQGGSEELYKRAEALGSLHVLAEGATQLSLEEQAARGAAQIVGDMREALWRATEDQKTAIQGQFMVLASTNAEKAAVSDAIRKELQDAGLLSRETVSLTVKHSVNLSDGKEQIAQNYVGENRVLIANGNIHEAGMKSGKEYAVAGHDSDKNLLVLRDETGREFTADPAQHYDKWSLYEEKNQELAIGEQIRCRKNDKLHGVNNGDLGTVLGKNEQGLLEVEWRTKDGEVHGVVGSRNNVLEAASASTAHSAQGKSVPHAYMFVSEASVQMADARMAYIMSSRHEQSLTIFVSNEATKEAVIEKGMEADQNRSAMDVLKDIQGHDFDKAAEAVRSEIGSVEYSERLREEQQGAALEKSEGSKSHADSRAEEYAQSVRDESKQESLRDQYERSETREQSRDEHEYSYGYER